MVLVDTSVWIDFFQRPDSMYAEGLQRLIVENNRAVLCGIVLQEILQGIRDRKSYSMTKERLLKFPYLEMNRDVYLFASLLYRRLREEGVTVPSVDVSIASLAISNNIPLYTKDGHFKIISAYSRLSLYTK